MKMWNALMEKMSSRDLIAFQLDGNHLLEQMWTKGDVFARFGTTPEDPYYGASRQAVGGYFIIKNSAASNEFFPFITRSFGGACWARRLEKF